MESCKPVLGLGGLGSTAWCGYLFIEDAVLLMESTTFNPEVWRGLWLALTVCGIVVTIWAGWDLVERARDFWKRESRANSFQSALAEYRSSDDLASWFRQRRLDYKLLKTENSDAASSFYGRHVGCVSWLSLDVRV